MAKQNKATFKAQQQALIDRVPPYDSNPLIQKTEDDEVRDQGIDNQYYEVPTEASITSPSGTFNVDFDTAEVYNIDTISSIPAAFVITLQNLAGNVVGKLNITKKSGDVITFGNAEIVPSNDTSGQLGKTFIQFLIYFSGGVYKAIPIFKESEWALVDTAVSSGDVVDVSDCYYRITNRGTVEFKGIAEVTVIGGASSINLFTIPAAARPVRTSGYVLVSIPYVNDSTQAQESIGGFIDSTTGILSVLSSPSAPVGVYGIDGVTYSIQ